MRQIRTFVVKIVVEEYMPDEWHGQITEPGDSIGWRVIVANADELSEAIQRRLIVKSSIHRRKQNEITSVVNHCEL